MQILLIGMFGLYNRGCEAIVWGSAEILHQIYPEASITVAVGDAHSASIDQNRLPDLDVQIIPFIRTRSVVQRVSRKLMRSLPGASPFQPPVWGFPLHGWDLILEVGGDTYAASDSDWRFIGDRQLMKQTGASLGLWGMNFDPDLVYRLPMPYVVETLRRYKLITVRDEESALYLKELGVTENVYQMADPAFAMAPVAWDMSGSFPSTGEQGVVGLNLSPFVARHRNVGISDMIQFAVETAERLISVGFGVLLVPHCFPPAAPEHDNDLMILQPVFDTLKKHGSVVGILPAGISSPQVKYAVSQCTLFAGARMHSTIAGWSTGVPVLSLGYSAKSRHINNAIYGHDQYWVDILQVSPVEISARLLQMHQVLAAAQTATREGVNRLLQDTRSMISTLKRLSQK